MYYMKLRVFGVYCTSVVQLWACIWHKCSNPDHSCVRIMHGMKLFSIVQHINSCVWVRRLTERIVLLVKMSDVCCFALSYVDKCYLW